MKTTCRLVRQISDVLEHIDVYADEKLLSFADMAAAGLVASFVVVKVRHGIEREPRWPVLVSIPGFVVPENYIPTAHARFRAPFSPMNSRA